jgi:glyoxylase I family protein
VTPSAIVGWQHLSLTVSDLEVSVPFYRHTLGFDLQGEYDHAGGRTVVLTHASFDFTLLLQQHRAHEGSGYSEHRPGLDHLAFRVADRAALDEWVAWFDELEVEHQPINDEGYGSVLIFRDPDRIRLELFSDVRPSTPPR